MEPKPWPTPNWGGAGVGPAMRGDRSTQPASDQALRSSAVAVFCVPPKA